MPLLTLVAGALGRIGRHGTLVVAGSLFIGLAIPPLAAVVKPYLGPVIVALLTLAFLRVEPAELRRHWSEPRLIALTSLWVMLVPPLVLGGLFIALGLSERAPGLYYILILQLSAPSVMSAPAMVGLLGLDVALTLGSLVIGMCVAPLTSAFFTHLFLGSAVISPLKFGLMLVLIIGGSAGAAALIRAFSGAGFLARRREQIDGLSVLAMLLFAIAAMDGVTAHAIANPLLVLGLAVLAFVLSFGSIGVTALIFLWAGPARALAIGLLTGSRNIGLMLTAVGFAVSDIGWLYFALAQLPIYLLPQLLKPLARRLAAKPAALQQPPAAC
jgi:BASS family bile acid:Na+ symporter